MALLSIENLCVELEGPEGTYRLLDEVNLLLNKGQCLGLVGESGCGKSMTALAIMGLLPQGMRAHGSILVDGEDLLRAEEERLCQLRGRKMAMVFQEPMTALNPVVPIGRQVGEGLRLHLGLTRHESETRATQSLARVGLPVERFPLGLFPHQLSGGQRQRVVIAMALACGPDILVADEPTTALDVTVQAQILDLLAEIIDEFDMGLVLITHDLGVVAETTDTMAVMYAGRVVEDGPTDEVFRRMAHPYTRGLFAAMPSHSSDGAATRTPLSTIPGRVPDALSRPAGCPFVTRCGFATDVCHQSVPQMEALGHRHGAACFNIARGEVDQ
ncbi:ABC transporter ATP-binding protein [Denitrobaculum tricleocarpae]|uniref:ABC transporter ATP-binding protein n=1 Tax=Denitrobaculum tricleocarpae TaxID=2591009 RepID=A0A545TUH3_9PROT|nr:ABC transporter ATP-binding protein [Denitrobaculum tricleocarpae]TQV80875.1 ABC transporter ATP-binding protein [Denitrobaculum tricleocarpae]